MADSRPDDVYLFLFPTNGDKSGGHLAVQLPPENETYYWSLDPEGTEFLPQDALNELNLPSVSFHALVYGVQWRNEVYDSIRDFHRTRGFDPSSQEVAIKIGYSLLDADRLIKLIHDERATMLRSRERRHSI
jgi:hypothetical protein